MANDILVKVGADITDFSKKMAESNKALSNFGKANQNTFDAFKKTGAAITGVGIATGLALGGAVKVAANFESGMSKVAAISGATGKDFDLLSDKAREMGAQTSFSATEAASGLEYMALAGWSTEQMLGGIEPVLHLAEAGALDLGRASDLVTDSMAGLGLEVKDLDGYLDKVAQTSRKSNTDIDALMEAMVIAGGTFDRFNVPLSEANSFLGVLANRGFKGSEAGTALNAIMTRLTASTGPSAKALDELGVSAFDSAGNFRGMEVVMKDVEKALSGLSDEERAHYQTQIAGLNHGKAFSAMLGGLANEYDELKGHIEDSDGALIDMRNTMKNNLQGALENLSSAFEEIMISIGTALLPLIKFLVAGLQALADWFNNLSDSTKSFIAITASVVTGLALIAGPLLLLVGFIPQIIAGFAAVSTVLAALFSPIGLIVGGVAALVAAFILAYKQSDKLRSAFGKLTKIAKGGLEKIFGKIGDSTKGLGELFGSLASIIGDKLAPIIEKAVGVFGRLVDAIALVYQGDLSGVIDLFKEFAPTIIGLLLGGLPGIIFAAARYLPAIADGIQENLPMLVEVITGVIESIVEFITEALPAFVETGVGLLTNIIDGIVEALPLLIDASLGIITTIIDSITEFAPTIIDAGINVVQTLIEGVTNALPTIIGAALLIVTSLADALIKNLPKILDAGIRILMELIDGILKILPSLIEAGLTLIITLASTLIKNLPKIIEAGVKILMSVVEGIIKMLPKLLVLAVELVVKVAAEIIKSLPKIIVAGGKIIVSLISGLVGSVGKLLTSVYTKVIKPMVDKFKDVDLAGIGKDIISGLINGIGSMAKGVWEKAKSIASGIGDTIASTLGVKSPSRVLMEIGRWTGMGLVKGIDGTVKFVKNAANLMADAATPDIDMSYDTPSGTYASMAQAVRGTVDVNSRDERLIGAINSLERRLGGMRIEMEGETVGRLVRPHVNEGDAIDSLGRYFD